MVEQDVRIELTLGQVCITNTKCRYVPHSPNKKMHWAEKAKWTEAWKDAVYYEWMECPIKKYIIPILPLESPTVHITIFTIRVMDKDNMYASCKAIIDGLTVAGLIPDDSQDDISLTIDYQKVAKIKEQIL